MKFSFLGNMYQTTSLISTALQHNILNRADRPAVDGRSARWTFAELDRKSASLAGVLQSAGVGAGDIVPLMMGRSPAMVLGQVTALRMGAAYSAIDPDMPASRLTAALDLLNPKVVVTDDRLTVPANRGYQIVDITTVDLDSRRGARTEWVECAPDDLAYVTFTSGTTGTPKGVMIPHSGIVRLVCNADWASFKPDDRWAVISAPAFDASTLEVWGPLLNGGCCVVQESAQPSLDELASFILDNRVTSTFLTSALFSAMTDHRLDAFRNLEQLIAGGERVSPHHARAVLETYPGLRLVNGYGPTENTTFSSCHTITIADTEKINGIPIGTAINGTILRIGIDAHDANSGELLTAGEGVALGYINDAELTAAKFVQIDGVRWYRTGDMVSRRADGVLEYKGRLDRQVKLQGRRIELNAIESVLSSCPGVGQCVAFVVGETAINRHLVACYTVTGLAAHSTEHVRRYLQEHLADHSIQKVLRELPDMPRTANGKTDLTAVQALLSRKTISPPASATDLASPTETRLKEIWNIIFPDAHIHVLSSFDQLAGTSMQALQLSAEVRRLLNRDLAPVDVIRAPVLRAQAALIDALRPLPLERADGESRFELTRMQRAILSAHSLDKSRCAYLVHVALRFGIAPNSQLLRQAFEQLAEHHPSLRLGVSRDLTSRHAAIEPSLQDGWWRDQGELDAFPDGLPDEVIRRINRPLCHVDDGVMRVDHWQISGGAMLVVWTIHHVAIDEASIDRCLIDLDTLMRGKLLSDVGQDPFGFAEFEKQNTQESAVAYWPNRFAEVLGKTNPALPRAPGAGQEIEIELPVDVSRTFLERCRNWETTPFAPLLVMYARAIQEVFGQERAFVVTPFSRHQGSSISHAVGCLLDLNVIEAGGRVNESVADNLARVQKDTAALQQTLFFPFERVAEEMNRRSPGFAEHLTTFGFTWRLETARELQIGGQLVRLIRVPQLGARFGLTMNCWSENNTLHCAIEIIDGNSTEAKASAVGKRFVENLVRFCTMEVRPTPTKLPANQPGVSLHPGAPNVMEAVRAAWMNNTHLPGIVLNDLSNFWAHGGNSLTALQMMSQLERAFRIQIKPSDFFALPTLGNLWRLASAAGIQTGAVHVLIGSPQASRLAVLFPGNYGSPLELYHLATHLERQLSTDHAVVIVDLEEILRRAPEGRQFGFVRDHCAKLLDQLGRDRVVALAGFSSGGIFALTIANEYQATKAPEVWMLDTYKPFNPVVQAFRRMSRPAIGALLRSPILAGMARTHVRGPRYVEPVYLSGTVEHARKRAGHELSKVPAPLPTRKIFLIQAAQTAREQLLLRNGKTNGFDPAYFTEGGVTRLDGKHNEIPGKFAEEVAAQIASSIIVGEPDRA
ncbi:MAG: amino acid adenylation domain-containing protein [Gemmatimonadaceae bacterium]